MNLGSRNCKLLTARSVLSMDAGDFPYRSSQKQVASKNKGCHIGNLEKLRKGAIKSGPDSR